MRAIGGETWAAAMGTVRGERAGGCGATVDGTAAGSPTAGYCMNTTSSYNFIQPPICCEACLDKYEISVELSKIFEST